MKYFHHFGKVIVLSLIVAMSSSCSSIGRLPRTVGDPKNAITYGYHPIDPLPIEIKLSPLQGEDQPSRNARIMKSLHDETMRIAVGQVDGNGGISFGPAKIGYEGSNYVVILDYMKFDTKAISVKLEVDKEVDTTSKPHTKSRGTILNNYYKVTPSMETSTGISNADALIPTYVGVGLRLTASITVNKGKVDLGNLFAIGAAAEANQVTGTLVIQTLGISGNDISALIPMPSEVSTASIQNSILSLASIKAKMYDSNIQVNPRIIGIYNNVGGGERTINNFITNVLRNPEAHIVE